MGGRTIASLEGRVKRLEMPETCRLYWPVGYVTSNWDESTTSIVIPTNFPTKRLLLIIGDDDLDNLSVSLPLGDGVFPEDRVVDLEFIRENTSTGTGAPARNSSVRLGGNAVGYAQANNQHRMFHLEYDAMAGSWSAEVRTLAFHFYAGKSTRRTYPVGWAETVEEWIAAR